ncbi:MAG TPA: toxic anion resistance protein [Terriglobia bacterium]|nr:toxic anion resistance protein [Terriglobia bacterium]
MDESKFEPMTAAAQGAGTTTPTVLLDLQPVKPMPVLPKLSEQALVKAQELSRRIDLRQSTQILTFGDVAQQQISSFSDSLLQQVRMKDAGESGQLLLELQTHLKELNPSSLTEARKLLGLIPGFDTVANRIERFLANYQKLAPTITDIETRLEHERIEAIGDISKMDQLALENEKYKDALQVAIAAAILAMERFSAEYEKRRVELKDSEDIREIGDLRQMWNQLQAMDRRVYALRLSLSLSETATVQIQKVKEIVGYAAESLGDARSQMIPAWKQQMSMAVTLLRSKKQLGIVQEARTLTDRMILGNAEMAGQLEMAMLEMQKRGFVDAQVLVKVNDALAYQIQNVQQRQIEAKQARAESIQVIFESQRRLVEAMKGANQELVATPANAKPQQMDIAADLLK